VLGGIGSGGPGTGVGLVGAGPGSGSVGTGKGGCSGGTGTSGGMLGDVCGFALILVLVLEWWERIGDGCLVSNAIMGSSYLQVRPPPRNGSNPARLDDRRWQNPRRADTRRRFALARPGPASYQALRLAAT